jgi:aryl-alcohol dehydrogenase-like predicted oxidoreductase
MFDTADIYSDGMAEEILGQAVKGRRDQVIISTKGTFRIGPGPNKWAPPAFISRGRSRRASGGLEPSISNSINFTGSTP